jgi:hypothetical protein
LFRHGFPRDSRSETVLFSPAGGREAGEREWAWQVSYNSYDRYTPCFRLAEIKSSRSPSSTP